MALANVKIYLEKDWFAILILSIRQGIANGALIGTYRNSEIFIVKPLPIILLIFSVQANWGDQQQNASK